MLDVGCGEGLIAFAALEKVGPSGEVNCSDGYLGTCSGSASTAGSGAGRGTGPKIFVRSTLGAVPQVLRPGQVKIHFTDDGVGTPLLLHTGAGGDLTMWQRAGYYDTLGSRRFLALDHRGHGQSTAPESVEGYRPEDFVGDVIAVLDEANVERAAFIGYSAGAGVLCRAARTHPDRCLGFIGLGFCPEAGDSETENPVPQMVREVGVRTLIEKMAAAEAETPPDWLVENLCETSDDAFALPLVAGEKAEPLWETLAGVTVPTLLICGSEEIDEPALEAAARRCRQGSSVRLDGYGHLQEFWHSEVTGAVMAAWLDEHGW